MSQITISAVAAKVCLTVQLRKEKKEKKRTYHWLLHKTRRNWHFKKSCWSNALVFITESLSKHYRSAKSYGNSSVVNKDSKWVISVGENIFVNVMYATQDEALSGAHTQLYGWTPANFPQSHTSAMTSGCEVKGELGRGGLCQCQRRNNRVTAVISQLDPVSHSTCPQKLHQHMHQAEGTKPGTFRAIKHKHQHPNTPWRLDSMDNWSPPDDVQSVYAWTVTRLLPVQDQDHLFAASSSIHYALGPNKLPWWITTFFWTCKLPTDQREGAVIMREIWHSRVGCALFNAAVNLTALSNKVIFLSAVIEPKCYAG